MENIETLPSEEKCLIMLREMYIRDVTNNMRLSLSQFSQDFKQELSKALSKK